MKTWNQLKREKGILKDMYLQEFLRNNNPEDLQKIGVYHRQHPKYPNLYQFTYDQIESDGHKSNPIVVESRGVILDRDNDWSVVARPFDRFFNLGEGCAAKFDWSTSRIQEKVDGSLCIVYFYDGNWQIATKGTPDASGNVNGYSFTFAELFWKIANHQGVTKFLEEHGHKRYTYLFELTSFFNRVVVPYREAKLTLLGARRDDGIELSSAFYAPFPAVNVVKEYNFNSVQDMVAFAKNLNGTEGEGFVVVDNNFNRVKVKGENYLALAHMKEGFGPRRVLEVVRNAELEEFKKYLDAFPEMQPLFDEVKGKFETFANEIEQEYETIKGIEDQKEFALKAVNSKLSGALFQKRKMGVSIKKYMAEMNIKHLADILNLKEMVSEQYG
jgi:hypothetical protein